MSDDLQELYRETILDHSRHPRGAGLREPFAAEVHHVNPVCGDEVTLRVELADAGHTVAGVVVGVSHESKGCSISVASTSVMAAAVAGRSVADVAAAYEAFHMLVTGTPSAAGGGLPATAGGGSEPGSAAAALESLVTDEDDPLADAPAFAGVARYPARVKCALLGWSALRAALVEADGRRPDSTSPHGRRPDSTSPGSTSRSLSPT